MKVTKYLLMLIGVIISLTAAAEKNEGTPRYDLFSYGVGVEGTYSAEVFVYMPKPKGNVDNYIKRAALHGVIFKGLAAGNGDKGQRPMLESSDEDKNKDFFNNFFNDAAECNRYVDIVDGSLRIEKIDKKTYKARAIVSVKKDMLRKHLEDNKIIDSFKNLF